MADTKTLSPQQKLIMDYLNRGRTITNKVAMIALGVGSLSSRIAELRKLGFMITDEVEYDHNNVPFKKYRLPKD